MAEHLTSIERKVVRDLLEIHGIHAYDHEIREELRLWSEAASPNEFRGSLDRVRRAYQHTAARLNKWLDDVDHEFVQGG